MVNANAEQVYRITPVRSGTSLHEQTCFEIDTFRYEIKSSFRPEYKVVIVYNDVGGLVAICE